MRRARAGAAQRRPQRNRPRGRGFGPLARRLRAPALVRGAKLDATCPPGAMGALFKRRAPTWQAVPPN